MEKAEKRYEIGNTIFTVLQIVLLIGANIMHILQMEMEANDIFAYIVVYVMLVQYFFAECVSIILGGLSYIKKWRKAMVWLDLLGMAAAAVLIVWSFIWGVMGGIEGAPFPYAIYVEVLSLVFLLVKTIVDGVMAIKWRKLKT